MPYQTVRGGHRDLGRIYPMMEFDFGRWELPAQTKLQAALLKGAELILLRDGEGRECGYALMLKSRGGDYVLLGWLGVYPGVRGGGIGAEFLSLLAEYYASYRGILLEVTKYPELEKARRLHGFYERNGYSDVRCEYRLYGEPAALMYRRLSGPEDISPEVRDIVRELYLPLYDEKAQKKHIEIR